MGSSDSGTLQSMTGFARGQGAGHGYRWVWELRSVNGKGLDIRFRGPPGMEQLEQPAREMIAARCARGSIQLTLALQRGAQAASVQVNRPVLDEIMAIADELRVRAGGSAPAIEHLLSIRGVVDVIEIEAEATDDLRRDLLAGLGEALDALVDMRRQEGAALHDLLAQRLDAIEMLTAAARSNPARSSDSIRARLAEQIEALLGASPALDPDRLHQEAVLLATRADIGEEIDRLDAHVAAARELLTGGGAVGRRLDFLAQEFNREANTLCSKSNDRSITAIGLDLKATVDQFREQVQNLE
jgi:uncharacterized protein (TIGR00255 family)